MFMLAGHKKGSVRLSSNKAMPLIDNLSYVFIVVWLNIPLINSTYYHLKFPVKVYHIVEDQ